MLSIIVPSEFDGENIYHIRLVENVKSLKDTELIFISRKEAVSRAERLNIGFHKSKGNIILLNHPRSLVEIKGLNYLASLSNRKDLSPEWGGFIHKFSMKHPLLNYTSWYSNRVRANLSGILYLDHCIYFHRDLWIEDLPPIEIFEDTVLSRYFKKHSRPKILPFTSETSAIRFEKNGVFNQLWLNQFMKICFYLGIDHKKMNKLYEKKIKLN